MERWRHENELKMSRQDLRDEYKETEGNPAVKMRIRRLQRQARRRRMLKEVERAAVVITNPTEFAIALEFSVEMAAPVVVAKGRNLLAARIREVARWHGIPLVENPPLAHALYRAVEVGQAIPPKLYMVVAEILAAIWRAQARASQLRGREDIAYGRKPRRPARNSFPEPARKPGSKAGSGMGHAGGRRGFDLCHAGADTRLVLDLLLAVSITASVLVLLSAIQILRPSQFSVFPSLLLLLTLFRLSLNLASSRRILLHGNEGASAAGQRDSSVRPFVVGGNYVVGFVIFMALIAIQYIVVATARCAPPKSRRASPSMPCPASRWRSTPI